MSWKPGTLQKRKVTALNYIFDMISGGRSTLVLAFKLGTRRDFQ